MRKRKPRIPRHDADVKLRRSRFNNTVLSEYLFTDKSAWDGSSETIGSVQDAFVNECSVLFSIDPDRRITDTVVRREDTRLYILKLLLHLGLIPKDNGFAAIARLIEVIALRPDLDLNKVILEFASAHNTEVSAVERVIDKNLNVYDSDFTDRITTMTITMSHPMTAKDALCDLAVFVRTKYFDKGLFNE